MVQLRPGQVWAADIFALPEYRNRHIARHLAIFGERWLAARGYTELFTSVAADNTASLRMSYEKGSRPFYHVTYFRLLLYERLLVSKEIPRQFEA